MSEYIEREAIKQIIAAQCGECADACLEFDGIQPDCNQCLLHGAKKAIESIPAADVRPVVRGKWNNFFGEVPGTTNFTVSLPQCSECGFVFNWNSPYCPSCGADMREES